MYNHDDGLIIFTVPNRDRKTVYTFDMKPYYVLCLVDELSLVLYYFDDDCGGSTFLQNRVAFTKIPREKDKNEV